jgi:guanidinoacetate N-methyltransferase
MRNEFFERWASLPLERRGDALEIGGQPIMYGWERPLMEAFATELAGPETAILEIGFGMGVFAEAVQRRGAKSHTIVEPHPEVLALAQAFAGRNPCVICAGYWQEVVERLGVFDAIFYDSFSPPETLAQDLAAFFEVASSRLLTPEGKLGFWVPGQTLPESVQREVLSRFEVLELIPVRGLCPPQECRDRGFDSTMLMPIARRPL